MVAILPRKEIISKIELMPNYLWHILVIANLWDCDQSNNPYYQQFSHTMPEDDIHFLQKHSEDIVWGNGKMGMLTKFFFFLPLEHANSDIEDLEFYYKRLHKSIFSNDWVEFYLWYGSDFTQSKIPKPKFLVIEKIGKILSNNYQTFVDEVWPKIKPELNRSSQSFNEYFKKKKIISRWQSFLNRDFSPKDFVVLFSYANMNEISFTNINYVRYNLYYNSDNFDTLRALIIKEVGINILSPELNKLLHDKSMNSISTFYENTLYTAFQAFVQTASDKLFIEENLQFNSNLYTYDDKDFLFFIEYFEKYFQTHNHQIDAYEVIKSAIFMFIDFYYQDK